MTAQTIQNGFVAGEISPSLLGRTDLAKWHQGAFTMRNMFSNYRGGAASRAGTAYVGTCKQPGTAAPPRDIPFQFNNTQGDVLEFGDNYMRIKYRGAYVTEAPKAILAVTLADPCVVNVLGHGYATGDWVYLTGTSPQLSGLTWVVGTIIDSNNFTLVDLFGVPVDSTAFTFTGGGGTAARIYTLATPYAAVDLPFLKYTQSADTMTLTCVNTNTATEYPSYELQRQGSTTWVLTQDSFAASIQPPGGVAITKQASTTVSTYYSYLVTAVSASTGEESVASAVVSVENNDIAIYAGSNTITWNPVAGAGSYNVYKATPSYNVGVPVGSLFGYCGSAYGTSFTDTNITADFSQVAPVHQDPFARGAITAVNLSAGGTGYTQSSVGYTITSATGSGFIGEPVVINGAVVAFIIQNGGAGYQAADTIALTGGTGATATLSVGPESGTYPGTVAYYQQRRVYAASLNNPDTYWFSQTGAFSNMDSSIPVTDADAITGTPWAQQVNGVQFMVPMPGGLVVLTGKGAWQLNGGNNAALTPSDQDASPQAYNGCNAIVPPIVVNYDILYLQTKGSIFRDLSYNFFVNIYTGTDLTVLSNQLFSGHTFNQWCWAEEPYKLAWATRDDGALLSLTYLKEQDVYAWSRHDTNGQFVGVCSITEPPVDAVYFIVKRFVRGQWCYYSERMDSRDWTSAEDCWCVDAGLKYGATYPAATLTASVAAPLGTLTDIEIIYRGNGYTSPTIAAYDPTGSGSGAQFVAHVDDGQIASVTFTPGIGYSAETQIIVTDSTGVGAVLQPIISNLATLTASAGVFGGAAPGDVIRSGGGMATITQVLSTTQVVANLLSPILATVPNDPSNTPVPAMAGAWSLSRPTSTVSGLNHLEGLTLAIVADGSVVTPQTVTNGSLTLPYPASIVLAGLPYTCQLQTTYLDPAAQPVTSQGKRKNIYSITVRIEASRGLQVGTNQPDASMQPGGYPVPWSGLKEIKSRNAKINAGTALPLFTGDEFINVPADWKSNGQVAIQQSYPMPCTVLAVVAYYQVGDTPG